MGVAGCSVYGGCDGLDAGTMFGHISSVIYAEKSLGVGSVY